MGYWLLATGKNALRATVALAICAPAFGQNCIELTTTAESEQQYVNEQGQKATRLVPLEKPVPGSEFTLPADLVLLAMGFVHPVHDALLGDLGLKLDPRGNVDADTRQFATSEPGVFAAGDCRRGQSLVVWALWEGREAARAVDRYLSGSTRLQSRTAAY